jgi:hypothetical protein
MKRSTKTIRTTIGDLAAAFYEAALAELKDETKAARVARLMVLDVVRRQALA